MKYSGPVSSSRHWNISLSYYFCHHPKCTVNTNILLVVRESLSVSLSVQKNFEITDSAHAQVTSHASAMGKKQGDKPRSEKVFLIITTSPITQQPSPSKGKNWVRPAYHPYFVTLTLLGKMKVYSWSIFSPKNLVCFFSLLKKLYMDMVTHSHMLSEHIQQGMQWDISFQPQ